MPFKFKNNKYKIKQRLQNSPTIIKFHHIRKKNILSGLFFNIKTIELLLLYYIFTKNIKFIIMKAKILLLLTSLAFLSNANAQEAQSTSANKFTHVELTAVAEDNEFLPSKDDESIDFLYNETFNNLGGSIDSPLDFDFGNQQFGDIPQDLLTEKGFVVSTRHTCKRAGEAILVKGQSAYLAIALGEMKGRAKAFDVYFRIKSETSEESLFSIVCTNSGLVLEGNYSAIVPTEWTWYKVPFTTGSNNTTIEFDPEKVDNGILIDEILVVSKNTNLNGPTVLPALNPDSEEFTANWAYSYDTKGVYLDVFSYEDNVTTREIKSETQIFENINMVDGKLDREDTGMPKGWAYRFTKTMDKVFPKTGEGYSIVLNKEIEYMNTPNHDEAPYKSLSFTLKSQGNEGKLIIEEKLPRLYSKKDLYINNPYEWSEIAELNLSEYASEAKVVDLSSKLSQKGIYVRFRVEGTNDKGAEISNVSYSYGGDLQRAKIWEIQDLKLINTTEYIVSEIDANTEYFYRVRSFDDNYISDYSPIVRGKGRVPSEEMEAPEVSDAENVTTAGFTARWIPSIYTSSYSCEIYREHEASANVDGLVFYSENFDNVEGGTIENPVYGEIAQSSSIGYYNALPGFMIDHGLKADGMLGIYNDYKPGKGWAYGHMISPVFSMPDTFYKLKVTAVGKAGTKFKISSFNDEGREIQTSRVGTFTMDNTPEDFEFLFPASNYTFFEIELMEEGYTLLFDKMEITIDLSAGDFIKGIVGEAQLTGAAYEYKTPNWSKDDKYYYQVKGIFIQPNIYHSLDIYISDPSRKVYVNYEGVGINETEETEANVYVANGELNVVVPQEEIVRVYDLTGNLVGEYKANEGLNTYQINGNGMFIVTVNNKAVKVIK